MAPDRIFGYLGFYFWLYITMMIQYQAKFIWKAVTWSRILDLLLKHVFRQYFCIGCFTSDVSDFIIAQGFDHELELTFQWRGHTVLVILYYAISSVACQKWFWCCHWVEWMEGTLFRKYVNLYQNEPRWKSNCSLM